MDRIKSSFSIKNLENLSGIKAHTIRIWEKRYNLLDPKEQIPTSDVTVLTVSGNLLNSYLLYNHGFKISKIASSMTNEIPI